MHHGPEFLITLIFALVLTAGALVKRLSGRVGFPFTIAMLLLGMLCGAAAQNLGGEATHSEATHSEATHNEAADTEAADREAAGSEAIASPATHEGAEASDESHGHEGGGSLADIFRQIVKGISADLIIFVFLPALIFESAFALDAHVFKKNLGIVALLAGPALLVTTLLTAALMVFLTGWSWQWGWIPALVFGALISATDPVAVVAILRELGVSKRLGTLIEGESLLNDGTAIVIFTVLFAMLTGEVADPSIGGTILKFLVVVIGGLTVGFLLSAGISAWIGRTFNDPMVEITLTIALGYFAMIVGEGFFHVSGVMALVVSGLWMGSIGRTRISPEVFHFLHHFWELLAYIANTLIFFLVGLVISSQIQSAGLAEVGLILAAYVGIMIIRTIVTFASLPLFGLVGDKVNKGDAAVMSWGGLRGAVSLALVLIVSQSEAVPAALRDQLLLVTVSVVLLTILVNGSTIGRLLRLLGYDQPPLSEKLATQLAELSVIEKVRGAVDDLSHSKDLKMVPWSDLKEEVEQKHQTARRELAEVESSLKAAEAIEQKRAYLTQVLNIEREAFWEAFSQGMLGRQAVRILNREIDLQLGRMSQGNLQVPETRTPPSAGLTGWLARKVRDNQGLQRWLNAVRFDELALQYDLSLGERFAAEKVLERMAKLKGMNPEVAEELTSIYQGYLNGSTERLEEMRQNLPEITQAIETRLARRSALNLEREAFDHLLHHGMIGDNAAQAAMSNVEEQMKRLQLSATEVPLPKREDLLKEIPLFAACSADERKRLAEIAADIILPKGEFLFREGDSGDSLYVIVRGAVQILKGEGANEQVLGTLGGGEIIGEMALLTGEPRSASARAATSVTLIKISRESFENLIGSHPQLYSEVWKAYAWHELDNYISSGDGYRGLTLDQKTRWLSEIELAEVASGGDLAAPEKANYAFVLHGELQNNGQAHQAPSLISLGTQRSFKAKGTSRIVWLPELES